MIIYPAIDIKNGKCVRLYQGDYQQETIYQEDPCLQARIFFDQGAEWLHIVDLDGAKNQEQSQSSLITSIIRENTISIQIGGGIRTRTQVENYLQQGAARIIIGSLAISRRMEVKQWLQEFGADKFVLSFDFKLNQQNQPMIATNAWQDISDVSLFDMIREYQDAGLIHVLCTNIMLDGTLQGPDTVLYEKLLAEFPFIQLQASGGISSLNDIKKCRQMNIHGAIIGRALYENKFRLGEVLYAG